MTPNNHTLNENLKKTKWKKIKTKKRRSKNILVISAVSGTVWFWFLRVSVIIFIHLFLHRKHRISSIHI